MMISILSVLLLNPTHAATLNSTTGLSPAMELLNQTATGQKILSAAAQRGIPITEGRISKTEIIATRTIQNQVEKLEFNVQVLIAKDKSPVFQAIDLVHELVHAVHPKSNPFDPALSATDYVREGIESVGGEAQAILEECRAGKELAAVVDKEEAQLIKARCSFVWKTEKDPNQWRMSFYHLGRHQNYFQSKLGSIETHPEKLEVLNAMTQNKDPLFTSAVANKPYPLALLDEYVEITRKICRKNLQRRTANQMEARCQSLSSAAFTP